MLSMSLRVGKWAGAVKKTLSSLTLWEAGNPLIRYFSLLLICVTSAQRKMQTSLPPFKRVQIGVPRHVLRSDLPWHLTVLSRPVTRFSRCVVHAVTGVSAFARRQDASRAFIHRYTKAVSA